MDVTQHIFSLDTDPRITTYRCGRHAHGNWTLRHNGRVVWTGVDVLDALAVRSRITARSSRTCG